MKIVPYRSLQTYVGNYVMTRLLVDTRFVLIHRVTVGVGIGDIIDEQDFRSVFDYAGHVSFPPYLSLFS